MCRYRRGRKCTSKVQVQVQVHGCPLVPPGSKRRQGLAAFAVKCARRQCKHIKVPGTHRLRRRGAAATAGPDCPCPRTPLASPAQGRAGQPYRRVLARRRSRLLRTTVAGRWGVAVVQFLVTWLGNDQSSKVTNIQGRRRYRSSLARPDCSS